MADDQKLATEALYKQNAELAVRNKTLSLLRALYQISILALEPEPLAEKIVAAVRGGLDLELVGILHFDGETDALTPVRFALSERLVKSEQVAGVQLETISIMPLKNRPLLAEVVAKSATAPTLQIPEVWDGAVSPAALASLTESGHIKNLSAYPLVINAHTVGILLIGLNRAYDTLSQFERDSLENLAIVTAVALDRAQLYQDLKTANAGQENLLHVMNHQIKGYLGKDRDIFAELLNGDYGTMPETAKPLLTEGLDSTTKGVGYVQGILQGASAASGVLSYAMGAMNLKEVVARLIAEQESVAKGKGLVFESKIVDGDYSLTGDATQLGEALRNLVENGIKYNTPGGKVMVTLAREGGQAVFSVKDNGVGVADDVKAKLFTAGGRSKDSTKYNPESSGFGLAFVKGVIDKHGGTVGWKANVGEAGTTFFARVPMEKNTKN